LNREDEEDEARALVRERFVSSGAILPDDAAKTLTSKIHRMASPAHGVEYSRNIGQFSRKTDT
jgi:hypothetical protein